MTEVTTRFRRAIGLDFVIPVMAAVLLVVPSAMAWEDAPAKDVAFPGRVVERETGRPIAGAEIVVERSIRGLARREMPPWIGETRIRTDADGRFRIAFPPEQVAEPGLCIAIRIRHPDFIPRRSSKVPLADLIRGQDRGDEPFFATIPLERGVGYTARVVVPGGKPAVGIPSPSRSPGAGRSGLCPSLPTIMKAKPMPTAASDSKCQRPRPWPSTSVRRAAECAIPLRPLSALLVSRADRPWRGRAVARIRLPGRLIDPNGRPIAGQTINGYPLIGHDRHQATTDDDGRFVLGPLRPANYLIYGEGQEPFVEADPDAPPHPRPPRVVQPVRIFLKKDANPEPLTLVEMPTVRVEVQFLNSARKPASRSVAALCGLLPTEPDELGGPGANAKGSAPTRELNTPETDDGTEPYVWGVQDQTDDQGRIVFHAPRGLELTTVQVPAADETVSFKHQTEPDGPILAGPTAELGDLEGDRRMTVIVYRAPTVLVTARTRDGTVPEDLSIVAFSRLDRTLLGSRFVRQSDGRYRSQSLMPDHEYEITVRDGHDVYDRLPIQRVTLPEGNTLELSFRLRKRSPPPGIGQPAPPFVLTTRDGQTLSLDALRGKVVLLHFWQISALPDLALLRAIHDRFGKDPRLTMIGLGFSHDPAAATAFINAAKLAWPQAVLRDYMWDLVIVAFHAFEPHTTFLIDTDGNLIAHGRQGIFGAKGKLIAHGRQGIDIEKAVAEALACP